MASVDDVKKLAALARLSIKEEDLSRFSKEFENILAYISQIDGLKVDTALTTAPILRNVLREDEEPTSGGTWTEKIVAQFPECEGNALKVKKIISHE